VENSSTSWSHECSSVCFHICGFLLSSFIDNSIVFSFCQ
jgi:hypothetical protein